MPCPISSPTVRRRRRRKCPDSEVRNRTRGNCSANFGFAALVRNIARRDPDGARRSDAPFSLHGQAGEWYWDETRKVPVRERPNNREDAK
jgi:hypothetical protein